MLDDLKVCHLLKGACGSNRCELVIRFDHEVVLLQLVRVFGPHMWLFTAVHHFAHLASFRSPSTSPITKRLAPVQLR